MFDFKEISISEVKDIIAKGQVYLIDVRDLQSFAQAHIKGAINFDDETSQKKIETFNHDVPLICYCYHGFSSQSAAGFFAQEGFKNVYSMRGGFEEWRKHYPVEGS